MNKKITFSIIGILLIALISIGVYQFSFISASTVSGPTLAICEDQQDAHAAELLGSDWASVCSTCQLTEVKTTYTSPPPCSSAYCFVQKNDGVYRQEWRSTCERDLQNEDFTARSVCAKSLSGPITGMDGASYFTYKEITDGSDVYYMSDFDNWAKRLKDDCTTDEFCLQEGTNARCVSNTESCQPNPKYYCSFSRIVKDDGCNNKQVIADCTGSGNYCEDGKSTCTIVSASPSDPSFTDGTDFENTGSDQFSNTGSDTTTTDASPEDIDNPWYKRFWNWLKSLFVI